MFLLRRKPLFADAAAQRAKARHLASEQAADPTGPAARRPARPEDETLAPHTVVWWNALPAEIKPSQLVQRFPRIANRLALCWRDSKLTASVFESLLNDTRRGRKGFPLSIANELKQLRQHHRTQAMRQGGSTFFAPPRVAAADASEPWAQLATSDR